jgi:hypothetical protein
MTIRCNDVRKKKSNYSNSCLRPNMAAVRYNSRESSRLVVVPYLGDKYVMTRRHMLL